MICLHKTLFKLYFYHLFLCSVFIWWDIFDLKEIKSWIHTCSLCVSVWKLTAMQGALGVPRAPNYSGPALVTTQNVSQKHKSAFNYPHTGYHVWRHLNIRNHSYALTHWWKRHLERINIQKCWCSAFDNTDTQSKYFGPSLLFMVRIDPLVPVK